MVQDLKKRIDAGEVFFGIKQSVKNSKDLEKVIISNDCRADIIEKLKTCNVDLEVLEISKNEVSEKLELNFRCEVFGVKK